MSAVSLVSALKWNLPTANWVYLNHKGKRGRMLWNDKEKYTSTKILAFCVQKRRGPYFLQCSRVHKAVHERHIRALGAQRWKRVAAAQCETFSSSTRKWLKFKTVENSIQLTMWFMLDFFFKGKKDSKLHFHCITPTQFSNSFFGFLDRKPKKVEKEKNVYLEMMIYIPALLQNSSITWGVSEMGTHMCSYNSPWCYRPFCLLRNSSNFRWWGWYVMHSSSEFLFRNFFWDFCSFVHFV